MGYSAEAHFKAIRSAFAEAGDPVVAEQQMAYMKGHFDNTSLERILDIWIVHKLPISQRVQKLEQGTPVRW
jgi:hypothetical protein